MRSLFNCAMANKIMIFIQGKNWMNECDVNNLLKIILWPSTNTLRASGTVWCVRNSSPDKLGLFYLWDCYVLMEPFLWKWHHWFNNKNTVGRDATICYFLSNRTTNITISKAKLLESMLSIWWKVKENGNDVMLPNRGILWDTSSFRWDKISLSILLQEVRKGLDFVIISTFP